MVFCLLIFWGLLVLTKNSARPFWLEELVRYALVRHLELSTVMSNVVFMEGA